MIKLVTALIAALVAGWVVAGSATGANAHCGHCGPLPPTVHVHVIYKYASYTHLHNKSITVHVPRYHRIVNITRYQPVIHIHNVTYIHHHKIFFVKNTYAHEAVNLRAKTYSDAKIINTYDSNCGCHR